jgi:ABC-2 type transport system permease protein
MVKKMNYIGFYTLYYKESFRFLKVYNQTLFAPVINTLIFLAIFMLAIGGSDRSIGGIPFSEFMVPGLIMMVITQNAFANSSSSMTMGKVLGHIIDLLIPPLSAGEITNAMLLAAITRGVIVGILTAMAIYIFVPFQIHHVGLLIFYVLSASFLLGLLGLLCGLLSNTFDQMSAITSYIITPLSFLSGTFYSVKNLPDFWYQVSTYNPFFYMIDGIRYAMTNYADGSINVGIIYLTATNIVMWLVVYYLIRIGFRLKS